MDEPKRSAAAMSRYLIPIGLGVLLIGWMWPEQDADGPGSFTVYYSRLLGIRFEGQGYDVRQLAGSITAHLYWVVLAVTSLRPASRTRRLLLLGAAGLVGLSEILIAVSAVIRGDDFIGVGTALSAIGGALLVAGAKAGLGDPAAPEIRESEGARA